MTWIRDSTRDYFKLNLMKSLKICSLTYTSVAMKFIWTVIWDKT